MNLGADPAMKITGRLKSAGGKFASPDGSKLGENFAIDGDFELRTDPVEHSIGVGGSFAPTPASSCGANFCGSQKCSNRSLNSRPIIFAISTASIVAAATFNLTKIGSVDVSGSVEGFSQSPKLRLQARSANFLPGGFYEFVLRSSFNREYPLLDKLTLGGELAFQCQIHGDLQSLITEGDLSLKAGELREQPEGWQIGPITLNLPFQISWPGSPQTSSAKPQIGVLAIEQARFGGQSVGRITAAISLSNNALIFPQPIHAEIFGGAVEISALRWPDVVNDPKQLSFSAEMKRLQLDDLTQALHWPPFSGTLTGLDSASAIGRQHTADQRRDPGRAIRRPSSPGKTRNRKSIFVLWRRSGWTPGSAASISSKSPKPFHSDASQAFWKEASTIS